MHLFKRSLVDGDSSPASLDFAFSGSSFRSSFSSVASSSANSLGAIAADRFRQLLDLADVAEAGAHHLRLVSNSVVVIDLRHRLHARIVRAHIVLAVSSCTNPECGQRTAISGLPSPPRHRNRLMQAKQKGQIAVNAFLPPTARLPFDASHVEAI